ncbi:MAG: response regulator, partial [Lentisphaerota bacterium]
MKTILSVDDDDMILGCFRDVLTERGYQVITTSDPNDVHKLLDEQAVDLITLDVHMPQKDGLVVFEELKKNNRVLPVLFVTAYPGSFSIQNGRMMTIW